MSKLSNREKFLLVVLLISLVGLLYYNFVLKEFLSQYNALNSSISDTQALINDYKIKDASLIMIDERLNDLHDELDGDIDKVLFSIDRTEILKMLDKTTASVSTAPDYFFPAGHVSLNGNYITSVEVSLTCSEMQLKRILSSLKRADYINRVLIASFQINDFESGVGSAKIVIEILTQNISVPLA